MPRPPRTTIRVSDELTVVVGPIPDPSAGTVAFVFEQAAGAQAAFRLFAAGGVPTPSIGTDAGTITLLLHRDALARLGGAAPTARDGTGYHLPAEFRAIARQVACDHPGMGDAAGEAFRAAKAIELLCETLRALNQNQLIPLAPEGSLSLADCRRIIAARAIIDQRCGEKLTLDGIARNCGLNRAKLTRGFREMFGCTIAEALAERRLSQASHLLLTTDLPVSSVGHESGFLNNASFARAFGRHYGRSPSHYRAGAAAA
jgi:AraC family transcriptional activator of pyochelin receptor